jgi:hypothetical protein
MMPNNMNPFDMSAIKSPDTEQNNIYNLAQTLYGEMAGIKDHTSRRDAMNMAAHSAVNTWGEGEWIKNQGNFQAHLNDRFYAPRDGVSGHNKAMQQSLSGRFNNDDEQNRMKDALQIASAAYNRRSQDKFGAQFYLTPDEVATAKKNKTMDFGQLEDRGSVAGYKLFSYKPEIYEQKKKTYETNAKIQWALKTNGLYDGELDGSIGAKSKEAIKAFQKANGLKPDGIVGAKTKKLMGLS